MWQVVAGQGEHRKKQRSGIRDTMMDSTAIEVHAGNSITRDNNEEQNDKEAS